MTTEEARAQAIKNSIAKNRQQLSWGPSFPLNLSPKDLRLAIGIIAVHAIYEFECQTDRVVTGDALEEWFWATHSILFKERPRLTQNEAIQETLRLNDEWVRAQWDPKDRRACESVVGLVAGYAMGTYEHVTRTKIETNDMRAWCDTVEATILVHLAESGTP